jgi:O-antigen/teichoic acid export membrane protein
MPAFIALIAFPGQLLGYFGNGYTTAAAVTVVLAVGQLVSAAAGPCGTVLNMSGRVGLNMVDNVAVLALNLVLNLVLIPRNGVLGAAVAWSLSLVLVNVAKVVQAYLVVGVRARGVRLGRTMTAELCAAAAALAVERWVEDWVRALVIGAPAILVVFVVVLVLTGVAEEDRALARSLAVSARRRASRRGRASGRGGASGRAAGSAAGSAEFRVDV